MRAEELALWSVFSRPPPRLTNHSRVLHPTPTGEVRLPSESKQPGPVGRSLRLWGCPVPAEKAKLPYPCQGT